FSAFAYVHRSPQSFSCPGWDAAKAAGDFFNFKVWVIIALAQAVIWGTVAAVSFRWLVYLWPKPRAAGMLKEVWSAILVRVLLFGGGLAFFMLYLTPLPYWDLGCFTGYIRINLAGLPAYMAAGLAAAAMWVLEQRVYSLSPGAGLLATTRYYLDLRHKLQVL